MKKISVQSLNEIFNVIEDLSSVVGWIRDVTGKKQIYVSSNYEKIWGHSTEELYQNPSSFNQYLVPVGSTPRKKNDAGINLYRVRKANGKVLFIKDQHYLLTNDQEIPVGHLGFAKEISLEEWGKNLDSLYVENNTEKDKHKNIVAIIQRELKIYSSMPDENKKNLGVSDLIDKYISVCELKITPREKICLLHLLEGNLPKQIAALMNISIRTIEFHLENLKRKFGCRNLLQLMSKISTKA